MIEMECKSGSTVTGWIFCREGRVIAARMDGDRGAESVPRRHRLVEIENRLMFRLAPSLSSHS
jgi:hypothetical protein